MKALVLVAISTIGLSAPCSAGSLDWADQDQVRTVAKLGSAFANANVCNFEIDTDGTAKVIKDRIAPVGKLTPEMASALMFSVVGIGAAQAQMLGVERMNRQQIAKYCKQIIEAFGPNGSSLSGILKR